MNLAEAVLCAVVGLAFAGRGLWTWLRGGPLIVKSSGRAWTTVRRASAFWLLIGAALVGAAGMRAGASAGVIRADAGFLIGFLPLLLCGVAVIAFRPRRVAGRPRG